MAAWLLLALSLLLVVACGVFVAGEFALLTADRSAIERLAEDGDAAAQGVLKAFGRLSTELAGIQVAITVTNLVIGFLAEPALASLLRPPLRAMGAGGATGAAAVVIGLVVATLLTMIFGELVPKNLAIAAPVATARAVQAPVRAFSRAMSLPIRSFDAVANRVLALFDLSPQEELASARSPQELLSVVHHSQRAGTLPAGTATLLARSLIFDDKRARDVLTARPQMVTVAATDTIHTVLDVVRDTGHSRLPVLAGGADDVVGMIETGPGGGRTRREQTRHPRARRHVTVVEVPETLELTACCARCRNAGARSRSWWTSTAVPQPAHRRGPARGTSSARSRTSTTTRADRPDRCRGVRGVRTAATGRGPTAATTVALPALGVYETVGGLVMHELGRLPVVGDVVRVDDAVLTVLEMDGRRVDLVRVRRAEPESGIDAGEQP